MHVSRRPRPNLQHVLSMPGFCSQTAYILSSHDCPIPTRSNPPCTSLMPPRSGACRPCVRSTSHRAGHEFSRLSRVSSMKRTSQITRIARMPRGSRHTRGQRSTLIKWIARVSLSSRKTRVERGSRHPRTPRREKATATTDRQRGRRLRQPPGLPRHHLSVFHQPAIPPRPPTDAPASHLLSPPSRPRAQASPTLERTQLHR